MTSAFKISSISSRVAQWTFEGQRHLVAEKLWTKEEWKTYKKEHPDTTVKPKFTKERTKGKKDDFKEKGKNDDKSKVKKDIEDKVKDKKTDDTDKIIEDEVNKKVKEKSKKKGVDAIPKKGKIVKVLYGAVGVKEKIKKLTSDMFGKDFEKVMGSDTEEALASLAGLDGLDGDYKVWMNVGSGEQLMIEIEGPNVVSCSRTIGKGNSGPYVYNNELELSEGAPEGAGTKILASQVSAARKIGADISCSAAGYGGFVGYYVWPRLGYDAHLNKQRLYMDKNAKKILSALDKGDLPSSMRDSFDEDELYVSDFMKDQKTRDWWRKNGWGFDAEFDTSAGSQSSDALDAYVEAKGYTESEDRNPTQEELKELKKDTEDKVKNKVKDKPEGKSEESNNEDADKEFKREVDSAIGAYAGRIGVESKGKANSARLAIQGIGDDNTSSSAYRRSMTNANMSMLSDADHDAYQKASRMTNDYVVSGYGKKSGAEFSAAVKEVSGGVENDHRMKTHNVDSADEELVRGVKIMMDVERQIISNSGLVDEDGNITLYRNAGRSQFQDMWVGTELDVTGNYVDSWTFNPAIAEGWSDETGAVIKATVPLDRVVASSVGRNGLWKDESEVILNGISINAEVVSHFDDPEDEFIDISDKTEYDENLIARIKSLKSVSGKIEENHKKEMQILDSLSDVDDSTPEQLRDLKESLGDRANDMTQNDLMILFKTLAKQGYFSQEEAA